MPFVVGLSFIYSWFYDWLAIGLAFCWGLTLLVSITKQRFARFVQNATRVVLDWLDWVWSCPKWPAETKHKNADAVCPLFAILLFQFRDLHTDHVFLKQLHDANGVPQSIFLSIFLHFFFFPKGWPQCYISSPRPSRTSIFTQRSDWCIAWLLKWLQSDQTLVHCLDNVSNLIKSDQIWNPGLWRRKCAYEQNRTPDAFIQNLEPTLRGFHPKKRPATVFESNLWQPRRKEKTQTSQIRI